MTLCQHKQQQAISPVSIPDSNCSCGNLSTVFWQGIHVNILGGSSITGEETTYNTHINSLDIQPIFRTVTSSPECCTKTPTRHCLSFLLCCVCMYMLGECLLMTVPHDKLKQNKILG